MCHIKYKNITATVHFHMLDLEKASYYEIVSDIPHKGFNKPEKTKKQLNLAHGNGVNGKFERGFIQDLVSTMQVGDSFLVPTRSSCVTVLNLRSKFNMKFSCRQVYKDHSYRVWRIE